MNGQIIALNNSPIKIIDNENDNKNTYRVLYKIPNTFNHIFVRINQEGVISILMSPLNIWPNPVINSKDKLVKIKISLKSKNSKLLIDLYFLIFTHIYLILIYYIIFCYIY